MKFEENQNQKTNTIVMERILGILVNLYDNFIEVLPNILGAIILFIVGWIVAKIAARIIKKVCKAIGLDTLAEHLNKIDIVSQSNIKVVPSKILSKVFYYIILLIFTIAATEVLGMEEVSALVSSLLSYIPRIIAALLLMVIGIVIADFLKNIIITTTESLGIPSAKIIGLFVFYFVLLMTVVTALKQLGIDTEFIQSNLTVIIGGLVFAFALGYGLASREMMANFLASFYSKERFKIGDIISVEGKKGEVIDMDSSSLTIAASDKIIIVPLSKLTSGTVEIFNQ